MDDIISDSYSGVISALDLKEKEKRGKRRVEWTMKSTSRIRCDRRGRGDRYDRGGI